MSSTQHDPKVGLQPFSEEIKGSTVQALQLSRVIRDEQNWLSAIRPATVDRYHMPFKGQKHIMRIAGEEAINGYIINQSRSPVTVGEATITSGQNVVHPEEGLIAGAYLDYWLRQGCPLETHMQVAALLCQAVSGPAFATVVQDIEQSQQRSTSFGEFMKKVGQPAILSSTIVDASYETASDGAMTQVYRLSQA